MIRIIHFSDLLLDSCYAAARLSATAGNARRAALRAILGEIVERARTCSADAILVAGNLIRADRVARETLDYVKELFESIPNIAVLIAPGSQDCISPESPYVTHSWPENVHLFRKSAWESFTLRGTLTVHGCCFGDEPDPGAKLAALEVSQNDCTHVAMLPVPALESIHSLPKAVQYVALGGQSARRCVYGDRGQAAYYSGSPEAHGFDDAGPHGYLEVEIDAHETRVCEIAAANASFENHSVDCSPMADARQLADALRALPGSGAAARLARIELTGRLAHKTNIDLLQIARGLCDTFAHIAWIDNTAPPLDHSVMLKEPTSLGQFLSELNAQMRDTKEERRRRTLSRAREVGAAAYEGVSLPIRGAQEL